MLAVRLRARTCVELSSGYSLNNEQILMLCCSLQSATRNLPRKVMARSETPAMAAMPNISPLAANGDSLSPLASFNLIKEGTT